MSDPVSGGAGKVAEQMLKEVQQAMQQTEQIAGQQQQVDPTRQFSEVLQSQNVQQIDGVAASRTTTEVLRTATAAQRAPAVPVTGQALDSSPVRSGFKRILDDVLQGQDKYGKILEMAVSGREFSQAELLALQAGVYRFSQELELTSKVIEKGTSAIKQTLNTQV